MGYYISVIDGCGDCTSWGDWYINHWWSVTVYSVQDMTTKILNYVGNGKISNLVILGHGQPGLQSVGCGQNPDINMEKYSATGLLVGYGEHYMSLLKPKFEPGAIVSLGGCGTGIGGDGDILLKRLATIFGVKVEASTNKKQRLLPGYEGEVKRCDANSCVLLPPSFFY